MAVLERAGESAAAGWRLAIVLGALAVSYAATLALGVGAVLLAREALRRRRAASPEQEKSAD